MSQNETLRAELPAGFDIDKVEWVRLGGSPAFDYPIDYYYAVIHADKAAGRLDLLVKWAPEAYCHYHRHVCNTVALVIDGEQHVIEERPHETVHKVRKPGFSGRTPDGETHMERAGPQGCNAPPNTKNQASKQAAPLKFRIIAVGSKIQQALNERLWVLCIYSEGFTYVFLVLTRIRLKFTPHPPKC